MTKSSLQVQQPKNAYSDTDAEKIFENIFDFYGTLDASGRVLNLSGRIFQMTNTDPELLIGQQFSQTVFWQSSENTSKILEKEIEDAANGEHSRVLLDFRISVDEKTAIEVNLQPLLNVSGQTEIFICAQSVLDRSQVEHSKPASEQLLFAAENAEIGLWFWNFREGRIYSTPRCNELVEMPAYEVLSYDMFRSKVHPEDRDFVDDFLSRSRSEGTKYEEEFRILCSDGRIEWICAEGKSFLDEAGNPEKMVGVIQKITDRKLAANELEKVYDREKKARDEAVEANRAKDFFLAFVSHELRSPLNAIMGWAKILLTKKVDVETRKMALETIERSARFQTKLINDLVDSARVSSGKLRLEYLPTNLFEIVRNSYQAQKPTADTRNITFELHCENERVPVFGDPGRLQQVFSNLISNAIKFTPDDGKVAVEIRTGTESAVVTIADSGQGIDSAALPNIFRQFSQGDISQAKNNAGLGLGLSIVQILVTKHGGFVQAESEGVGKGSKFTVTLPLSEDKKLVSNGPEEIEGENRTRLEGVKILIVEDDRDSREVLHLFFEQSGALVTSVESAKAAIDFMKNPDGSLPDVIISDLAMPDEDGYSLIGRIREMPAEAGGQIPALALSAFTSAESKQKAFNAGFDKYSTKPFEPDLLINDIEELVGKKDVN